MDYIDITAVGDVYRSKLPTQEKNCWDPRTWETPVLNQETPPYACPGCGIVFEPGKAYGYVCPKLNCPTQPKAT